MFEDYYMTVDEVAKALKISKSFAYKVIRKMNAEMQKLGFFTVAGKVNKQYFDIKLAMIQPKQKQGSDINGCLSKMKKTLGEWCTVFPIGKTAQNRAKNEDFRQGAKYLLGSVSF